MIAVNADRVFGQVTPVGGNQRVCVFALTELGDLMAGRAARAVRRASQLLAPLLILAVGLLVGFIVVSMFVPLIDLLGRVAE